jgi:hypothetical protein
VEKYPHGNSKCIRKTTTLCLTSSETVSGMKKRHRVLQVSFSTYSSSVSGAGAGSLLST